ncbi:MAG: MlaD family protein [Acidobacteria bacterium]|nr:MlaD family protein [Acidobacteriota bacterium]
MPSAQKVAWAQLRVGITAVVALCLIAFLVFLMTGTKDLFARNVPLYTFLDDSGALEVGAPVRLNGIVMGKVTKVDLSGSNQPGKTVRVDMEVPEKMLRRIPLDSQAAISSENVLGTKFINITRGTSPESIKARGTVRSLDTKEFGEVVQTSYTLLTSLQGILKRIDAIVSVVEAGKGSIGKLLVDDELYTRLVATVAETQKVTTALGSGKGTIGRLLYDDTLYQEVRGPIARLDSLIQGMQQGQGTAGKFLRDPALYNELRQTTTELHKLVADLNAGKGTAGKLLKSDELSSQLKGTMGRVDNLLDRVNSGQGTIGQLVVNPALYDSLNGATKEMNGLLKDFRANPKKFLRIKLGIF